MLNKFDFEENDEHLADFCLAKETAYRTIVETLVIIEVDLTLRIFRYNEEY
ncbi:MAG: hypothetical protein AAFN93_00080 [Bacteroidota bacterium]